MIIIYLFYFYSYRKNVCKTGRKRFLPKINQEKNLHRSHSSTSPPPPSPKKQIKRKVLNNLKTDFWKDKFINSSVPLCFHDQPANSTPYFLFLTSQELLVYLGAFARVDPALFKEMLRLRVGLIIEVMVAELARSMDCAGDKLPHPPERSSPLPSLPSNRKEED